MIILMKIKQQQTIMKWSHEVCLLAVKKTLGLVVKTAEHAGFDKNPTGLVLERQSDSADDDNCIGPEG